MSMSVGRLEIHTPEGISFSFVLASPVVRFVAFMIDVAAIAVIYLILLYAWAMLAPGSMMLLGRLGADLTAAALITAFFLLRTGYAIILEWFWRGQTLGKRLLGLRVVDEQALRLEFSQIAIRNILRVVDALPAGYLVGGIAAFVNRHGQRLGDLAANTVVIRTPRAFAPDLNRILPEKYNSLRDYPHLAARLRQRVTADEARIALQALLRRDRLDPQERIRLFEELADHFRALVPFPEEAALGVNSEQYVRNVLDVVYRVRPADGATGA